MLYLTVKWLHIVSVISWMAGLLYLYRLLIYLAEKGANPDIHALLCTMARRLYKIITIPATVVAVIAGLAMVGMQPAIGGSGWFIAKFCLVLVMLHFTVKAGRLVGRFEQRATNVPSSRALRIMNEIPTILMLVIVALVVFKPF